MDQGQATSGWGADAFDRVISSGEVANFRRHGDRVRLAFTPPRWPDGVVELSAEDCLELGAALIEVGRAAGRA